MKTHAPYAREMTEAGGGLTAGQARARLGAARRLSRGLPFIRPTEPAMLTVPVIDAADDAYHGGPLPAAADADELAGRVVHRLRLRRALAAGLQALLAAEADRLRRGPHSALALVVAGYCDGLAAGITAPTMPACSPASAPGSTATAAPAANGRCGAAAAACAPTPPSAPSSASSAAGAE